MKKFKLVSLFVLVFVFATVVHASAHPLSDYVTQAGNDSGYTIDTDTTSTPGKIIITAGGMTLTADYNENGNYLSYEAGTSAGANDTTMLLYLLKAIAKVQGESLTTSEIRENLSTWTIENNGITGVYDTSSSKITKVSVYADCFNKAGNGNSCLNSTSSGSNSSSSSTTNTKTTTTTTTVNNPKTGVFVPVVGISVLIVASVVCLVWISKKSVFKL